MAERVLLAGGRAFRLPAGAEAVAPLPLSPAPLAAPGLLGLAVTAAGAVPVLAAAPGLPGGLAWVRLPESGLVVAGESLLEVAPPGAEPLQPSRVAARPPPAVTLAEGGAWAVPARTTRGLPRALAIGIGGRRLVLPFAALEHLSPLPGLRPAPGADGLALGYALAEGAPVLVLDPAALDGAPEAGSRDAAGAAEPATLLVLFRHAGRRLGLPCARIAPARAGEPPLTSRLDALLPRLGIAPLGAAAAPPPPEPTRTLLLCQAGGQPFALPVEEVAAVIPPLAPSPAPPGPDPAFRGVAAHRGEVLPVIDAGARLGLAPVLAAPGQEAPMLRLGTGRPVALAVAGITGLRRVPARLVSDVAGEGPVAAVAAVGDAPLPVCRASVLAGAP